LGMSRSVNNMGDQSNQQPPKLKAAERQRRALELRALGLSYDRIASELGYRGRSGAWRSVQSALAKVRAEGVTELRTLESERLDQLLSACWKKAVSGDPKSINAALRVCERRARLMGLDAPTRYEIAQLLQTEDWRRVKETITKALEPWPEASRAVAAALMEVDGDN